MEIRIICEVRIQINNRRIAHHFFYEVYKKDTKSLLKCQRFFNIKHKTDFSI